MKLTLLGTGCPLAHPHRHGAASLVRAGEFTFLVDCGSGVTQRLAACGLSGRMVDAVFLTHLHSDHVVDFYQLIISSWHAGRARPHEIFGPPGTRRFVNASMAVWEEERALRIAWERRPSTAAFELAVTEFDEGEIWSRGGVRVSAFRVNHHPVPHAFGFRFEHEKRSLVFSGDTTVCENLELWARGTDALVHEVFLHREMLARPGERTTEGIRNGMAYHTISSDVGGVAARTGARALVLNHFVPPIFDREALLTEIRECFQGPVLVGEDLMEYDLATRTVTHAEARISLG